MSKYGQYARERMDKLKEARFNIKVCCDRIQELENYAQCCGSINITDKVQTSPTSGKMESAIADLIEEKEKLADLIRDWLHLEDELLGEMNTLGVTQREILMLKYSRGMKDEDIAHEIGYSIDHTRRLRRQALEVLGREQEEP